MYHISLLNCRKMSGSRKLDNFEPSIVYIYENFLTVSLVRGPYSYFRINIGISRIFNEITNHPLGRILTLTSAMSGPSSISGICELRRNVQEI